MEFCRHIERIQNLEMTKEYLSDMERENRLKGVSFGANLPEVINSQKFCRKEN